MTTKSRKQRNLKRRLELQKQNPPKIPAWRRFLKTLLTPAGGFWTAVALSMTMLGTYYLFQPKVSVEPDNPLDPRQPLLTPFKITNESALSIYRVNKELFLHKLLNDVGGGLENMGYVEEKSPEIPILASKESTTIAIKPNMFTNAWDSADLEVIVSYKTAILRRAKRESFRFVTRKLSDGTTRWYHKAVSEK